MGGKVGFHEVNALHVASVKDGATDLATAEVGVVKTNVLEVCLMGLDSPEVAVFKHAFGDLRSAEVNFGALFGVVFSWCISCCWVGLWPLSGPWC